jgi:hypothetical protein
MIGDDRGADRPDAEKDTAPRLYLWRDWTWTLLHVASPDLESAEPLTVATEAACHAA